MAVRLRSFVDKDEMHRHVELDRLLDVAEPALREIAAKHSLRENRIDRWRWDQPEVVLSWVDRDRQDLRKNIRFYVDDEGSSLLCSVEVNAWRDKSDKTGRLMRKWRHDLIRSWREGRADDSSAPCGRVSETLGEAYDTVDAWTKSDLKMRHYSNGT